MNGFDMLKALRKSHTPDQLPVIMVTGRAGADDVETALAAGANDYVTKPIDFPDLLARIQTLLSRKHAEKVRNESGKGFILAARDTNGSMWE